MLIFIKSSTFSLAAPLTTLYWLILISLLVNPDLIGQWLQQFWATASLRSINEVPHIRAMVAGKRVLISEKPFGLIYYSMMQMKLKKRGKKQTKKVSSVKLGRNKDEGNLSEEHHDPDDHNHTAFVYEDFDATDGVVTPDLERKSDETE
ncbi:hypothetical protein Tco_0819873 [Tanacetum coccineum]|uniref:Uncharacterized protein n=1 Tax=Tanacetum coccineum TaxID=301880 RepID=A0ABQ5ACJ4_9ASTR